MVKDARSGRMLDSRFYKNYLEGMVAGKSSFDGVFRAFSGKMLFIQFLKMLSYNNAIDGNIDYNK